MNDAFVFLDEKGAEYTKLDLPEVPKTAEDVRRIYGSPLSEILKTLIFVNSTTVVAVVPGNKEVDMNQLSSISDADGLQLATPNQVPDLTGKKIGSLDPFVRPDNCISILDQSVASLDTVNMGGGTPGVGIEMRASELLRIWDGMTADISE